MRTTSARKYIVGLRAMARTCATLLVVGLIGCASQSHEVDAVMAGLSTGRGYTLVNLHPDDKRNRLFAVNYQQKGLIPVCTEVEYLGLGSKSFKFRVVSTGVEYDYLNHKAAAEPFPAHLKRFFGPSCPSSEVAALSSIDRQGVREGRAIVGMSRRGVVLAMGHPPRHVNPDADALSFVYWTNKFNRVRINFDASGRVGAIEN